MKKITLCAAALALLCACQEVPSNKINLPTRYGKATWEIPKEQDIEGLEVDIRPDGSTRIRVGKSHSANQADIVKTVVESNERLATGMMNAAEGIIKKAAPVPVP